MKDGVFRIEVPFDSLAFETVVPIGDGVVFSSVLIWGSTIAEVAIDFKVIFASFRICVRYDAKLA